MWSFLQLLRLVVLLRAGAHEYVQTPKGNFILQKMNIKINFKDKLYAELQFVVFQKQNAKTSVWIIFISSYLSNFFFKCEYVFMKLLWLLKLTIFSYLPYANGCYLLILFEIFHTQLLNTLLWVCWHFKYEILLLRNKKFQKLLSAINLNYLQCLTPRG